MLHSKLKEKGKEGGLNGNWTDHWVRPRGVVHLLPHDELHLRGKALSPREGQAGSGHQASAPYLGGLFLANRLGDLGLLLSFLVPGLVVELDRVCRFQDWPEGR